VQAEQKKYGPCMTVVLCLWLGLFPLLQTGTYAHLTRDKWMFMLILTGVSLVAFAADAVLRRVRFSLRPPVMIGLALLLWIVLSCLLSPFSSDQWWIGASSRREGLASQLCYLGLFLLFAFSRPNLRPALFSAAAGVAVFGVIVVLQRAGGNPLGLYPSGRSFASNPEFQGTIGNIDMGTGYLMLMSALLASGVRAAVSALRGGDSSRVRFPKATLICCSAALLFSVWLIVTMGVQFGIISLGVLALWTLLSLLPKKARLPVLFVLILLVLLTVSFWPGQSGGLWELHETLSGRPQLSFGSNRFAVWLYSLGLSGESLLTGGGSDTFEPRFNQYLADHDLTIPDRQGDLLLPHYFDNPHNEYLAHLTNHGLPAMLLFIALILSALLPRREKAAGSSNSLPEYAQKNGPDLRPVILCYAVQAFFSFSVCIVAPMFWVLLGTLSEQGVRDTSSSSKQDLSATMIPD